MIKGAKNPAAWKPKIVQEIVQNIEKYPTIAVIDMMYLPSKQLQIIRAKIKDHALIIMTRKRLIKHALENCKKPSVNQLLEYITGMPALLFSDMNAFELFAVLKANMSDAPIKAGQEAPYDLIVPAGPTPFAPGPIISELGAAKIKASIQGGKVVVVHDSTVAKAGEQVSEAAAGILTRLGVHPMKIGINIQAVLEKEDIYTKAVLDIDSEQFTQDLLLAHQNAFKLALGLGILTKETVIPQIQKAYLEAKQLAISQNILADEVKNQVLAKVNAQVEHLRESLPEAKVEAEKSAEPKSEEKPTEEAKPEEKAEEKKEEAKE